VRRCSGGGVSPLGSAGGVCGGAGSLTGGAAPPPLPPELDGGGLLLTGSATGSGATAPPEPLVEGGAAVWSGVESPGAVATGVSSTGVATALSVSLLLALSFFLVPSRWSRSTTAFGSGVNTTARPVVGTASVCAGALAGGATTLAAALAAGASCCLARCVTSTAPPVATTAV